MSTQCEDGEAGVYALKDGVLPVAYVVAVDQGRMGGISVIVSKLSYNKSGPNRLEDTLGAPDDCADANLNVAVTINKKPGESAAQASATLDLSQTTLAGGQANARCYRAEAPFDAHGNARVMMSVAIAAFEP